MNELARKTFVLQRLGQFGVQRHHVSVLFRHAQPLLRLRLHDDLLRKQCDRSPVQSQDDLRSLFDALGHVLRIERLNRGSDGWEVPAVLGAEEPEIGPNHVIHKHGGILDPDDFLDVEFLRNLSFQPLDAPRLFGRFRYHADLGERLAHLESGVFAGGPSEAYDPDDRSHILHEYFIQKRFVRLRIVAEVHAFRRGGIG